MKQYLAIYNCLDDIIIGIFLILQYTSTYVTLKTCSTIELEKQVQLYLLILNKTIIPYDMKQLFIYYNQMSFTYITCNIPTIL